MEHNNAKMMRPHGSQNLLSEINMQPEAGRAFARSG